MSEHLLEFIDSRGQSLRVDRDAGVIRGVKLLGLESRNGRAYLPEALAAAVPLYEGAKVNVNHPKGSPLSPRDYQERIGVIRRVVARSGEGLFGDLHFNPKHALAEQLAWDAAHAPQNVGFSHNVLARVARRGDREVVEAIERVRSVDLVADPATTRGLFESASSDAVSTTARVADRDREHPLASLTADALRLARPDLVAELTEQLRQELDHLRGEVERHQRRETAQRRRALVRQLLTEQGLPDPDEADAAAQPLVSAAFLESLLAAPDDATARRLIDDRAKLVAAAAHWPPEPRTAHRPRSREQAPIEPAAPATADAAAFARAIT